MPVHVKDCPSPAIVQVPRTFVESACPAARFTKAKLAAVGGGAVVVVVPVPGDDPPMPKVPKA